MISSKLPWTAQESYRLSKNICLWSTHCGAIFLQNISILIVDTAFFLLRGLGRILKMWMIFGKLGLFSTGMEEAVSDNNPLQRAGGQAYVRGLVLAIAWIVTVATLFSGLVPLLLPVLLTSFFILILVYGWLVGTRPSFGLLSFVQTPGLALLAFSAYIAISSLWSAHPSIAIGKALLVGLIVMSCQLAYGLTVTLSSAQLHAFSRGIIVSLCLSMLFLCFEGVTGNMLLEFVVKWFPHLIKNSSETVPLYYLNGNICASLLFFWPGLLIIRYLKSRHLRVLLPVFLTAITLVAIFASQSETAKVSFVFSFVVFVMARFHPIAVHNLARILWVVVVLAVIPIVHFMYASGLQNVRSLPYSTRDRIHIWHYTASQIKKAPLLGIGVRSSRFLVKERHDPPERPNMSDYPDGQRAIAQPRFQTRGGWHVHNIFLQTWYELGAIGTFFLLISGLFVLQSIRRLESRLRPFVYAGFSVFGIVAAFGFGMWQSWLLASFGWAVIFYIIAIAYARIQQYERVSVNTLFSFFDAKGRGAHLLNKWELSSSDVGQNNDGFGEILEEVFMKKFIFLSIVPVLFTLLGFFVSHWLSAPKENGAPIVLSSNKTITLSSYWQGHKFPNGGIDGVLEGKYGFSTNREKNPWWQIDLGIASTVTTIEIFNRTDCCMELANRLFISVSDDGQKWQKVYIHDGSIIGGANIPDPLLVEFSPPRKTRYVRIALDDTNFLHLDEVIIEGYLPVRAVKK